MFKSTSSSLILIGVLALIIGIVAIAWPGVTILALVIMFAIYAFADGAFRTDRHPASIAHRRLATLNRHHENAA